MRLGLPLGLLAAGALVGGCGGGNSARSADPLLAPIYAGTIPLAVCGTEPCTLQLEPTLNLGAVGGTVSIVDVNNRALYRGAFSGSLAGARIGGNSQPSGLGGTLTLTLDATSGRLDGAFVFTPTTGAIESGTLETSDVRTRSFDPKGKWSGFVEFSDNLDFFDATLDVKAPAGGLAAGTATWIGAGGDAGLPFVVRALQGASVYTDAASGRSYLAELVENPGGDNLRLVVLEPDGAWIAFDAIREAP